jgi:hypothetical protein
MEGYAHQLTGCYRISENLLHFWGVHNILRDIPTRQQLRWKFKAQGSKIETKSTYIYMTSTIMVTN